MSGRSYGGTAAGLRFENEKFACEKIRLSRVQSKKWVRIREQQWVRSRSRQAGRWMDRQARRLCQH